MKSKWTAQIASIVSTTVAVVCPLCIPALGALLASIGFGFAVKVSFLKPFLIVLLVISLASLAWSARLHRQWWILIAGFFGAVGIYASKYLWFSPALLWTGATFLMASIINFSIKDTCKKCK